MRVFPRWRWGFPRGLGASSGGGRVAIAEVTKTLRSVQIRAHVRSSSAPRDHCIFRVSLTARPLAVVWHKTPYRTCSRSAAIR